MYIANYNKTLYLAYLFDYRFTNLLKMQEHLSSEHNYEVSVSAHEFKSMAEFEEWKIKEETASKSYFVRNSSSKICGSNKFYYYYCNRSGSYKGKGSGKRQLKIQGSCKTGKTCIAHLKVTENLQTQMISVQYCSTHSNHHLELCHLPVPKTTKQLIAMKLQEGVSIERILDDIRDNLLSNKIGRNQLVTRQDIMNIQKQINIDTIQKDANDLLSVCAWVKEL